MKKMNVLLGVHQVFYEFSIISSSQKVKKIRFWHSKNKKKRFCHSKSKEKPFLLDLAILDESHKNGTVVDSDYEMCHKNQCSE